VAVDVYHAVALGAIGDDRVAACPQHHPRHRHAAEQRAVGALEELRRPRVLRSEAV